jgi:hypothetical protein
MGRVCNTNGVKWTGYRLLVGKAEGKRPPRSRRVDTIKIDLREDVVAWTELN